jgi:cell division protein FtsW (lipid II flippase)
MGILPLTGITLPLLSYGGSSLLATFILIGLMYKLRVDN